MSTAALNQIETFRDSGFAHAVLESEKPVLVDFWADWCQPCHALAPTIQELANEYEGHVKVGKLDVDANYSTAGAYGIRSIPTVLVFKDGEVADTIVGVNDKQVYLEALEQTLVSK